MCIKALTLVNGSSMICYIANKIIYQSRSTLFPKDFVRKLLKMVLLNINAPPPSVIMKSLTKCFTMTMVSVTFVQGFRQ